MEVSHPPQRFINESQSIVFAPQPLIDPPQRFINQVQSIAPALQPLIDAPQTFINQARSMTRLPQRFTRPPQQFINESQSITRSPQRFMRPPRRFRREPPTFAHATQGNTSIKESIGCKPSYSSYGTLLKIYPHEKIARCYLSAFLRPSFFLPPRYQSAIRSEGIPR